jgi:hypothetical protein
MIMSIFIPFLVNTSSLWGMKLVVQGICSPAYTKISKRNLHCSAALQHGFFILIIIFSSCSSQPIKTENTENKGTTSNITKYYEGDGGINIKLTVLEPVGDRLDNSQKWILPMIQGTLTGYFNKYSKMTVLDRQRLETIVAEQQLSTSGIFSEEDYIRIGHLTNTQYILTGELSRTPAGFMIDFGITHVETGQRKASFPPRICTLAELQAQVIIKEAFIDLAAQMGVILTERGRNDLNTVRSNAVDAEVALARGITALRNGTTVQALSYYIQASNYDPELAEAASRLNILTVDIHSGNIGADVRNDIEWREKWISRLKECEEFYAGYMKEYPPYYIVYATKLGHLDQIDYNKKTYPLTLKMGAYPAISWFSTANRVVQTVKRGLDATGRSKAWGLNWPKESLFSPSPFSAYISGYTVLVEIINSEGNHIAGGPVKLIYGWEVDIQGGNVARPIGGACNVVFYGVDPYKTTDSLSIRITSVDGIPAENLPEEKHINIITENEYIRIRGVVY